MTSIAARNGTLGPTIESLKAQTLKPDQIRLYIDGTCEDPPDVMVWDTRDRGPLTKLSAVTDASLPDDALIVTVDDDVIYHPRWLEVLVSTATIIPDEAHGMAGWNVRKFLDGSGDYEWPKHSDGESVDVLEGWAGVAYRKHFFGLDVWDVPDGFRYVDDVWISSYLNKRGITRRVIRTPMCTAPDHDLEAIHKRPDFVELNRLAAIKGFS